MNKQNKRKWLNELLVIGYTRNLKVMNVPQEISLFIQLLCSIPPPYCLILFDFDSDKKVYLKLQDIFPNLMNNSEIRNNSNISDTNTIFCSIRNIDWNWNKQYLSFSKVAEEDQDYVEYDCKLIQADSNGVHTENWERFMKKLSTSNIGIQGYVKKPRTFISTAVAFDKINQYVLDLIQEEFDKCQLRARWDISFSGHEQFKWDNYNYGLVNDSYEPSQWILNALNMKSLTLDNVPIYFDDGKITNTQIFINLCINAGDDTYYKYNWGKVKSDNDDWLNHCDGMEFNGYSKSILLSARICGENKKFDKIIRDIIKMYKWERDYDAIFKELDEQKLIYIWTDHENDQILITEEKLDKTLSLVDEIAQFYQTDITIDGEFDVDWE